MNALPNHILYMCLCVPIPGNSWQILKIWSFLRLYIVFLQLVFTSAAITTETTIEVYGSPAVWVMWAPQPILHDIHFPFLIWCFSHKDLNENYLYMFSQIMWGIERILLCFNFSNVGSLFNNSKLQKYVSYRLQSK